MAQLLTPVLELFRNTAALALLPVFVLILGIGVAGLLKGLFVAAGFSLLVGGIVVTTGTVVASLMVGVLVTLAAELAKHSQSPTLIFIQPCMEG